MDCCNVAFGAGGGADVAVPGSVAVPGRARSPDLRVLHHHHEKEEEEEDAATQKQPPPAKHHQQQVPAGCDLYEGRWTFDAAGEQSPLYRESECEFLTEQVTCMRNGRRDDSYQKWRWQPNGCDMPSSQPASMLIAKPSIKCMQEYNATVEFYWAPFLVQSNSDDPQVHSVMDRVIAWRAIAKHANNWKGVDYLVFNTYIWWLNTFEMKVLKGSGALRNNKGAAGWSKYALVDRPVAYREVLKTWAKWVDGHIDPNRTTVFFMGMSPNHITPWAWGNDGGIKCAMETQPIVNRTAPLNIGTDWRLHGVARGVLARYLHRVPVHFVDITGLSELRKDAHTSVHTLRQGKLLTPEQQADPKTYADCIHWCLPGLPDTWNHFIYAQIVSSSSSSSDA
ncbi:protein trichome birefringence-like 28 [Panicum miliaceum]|uniref:Protein trichome birefringence-like 28 n=1 Tax=Panicum miliaceum TaxID=4540 RepID=A0A3L6TDK8_PANMI|nr:protein trichome birefringence-like 28 [Panicum miliaceum]